MPPEIDRQCIPAGIVDDIFGVNFVQGGTSGDPYDDNGHGTFVAGVVGAVGNNGIGTSGVSQVASVIGKLTHPKRSTPRVNAPNLKTVGLGASMRPAIHSWLASGQGDDETLKSQYGMPRIVAGWPA